MTKYRRRFEIIADIIKSAENGTKKTKIMYFANLSYMLLKRYLEETVKVGFIKETDDGYESTEKGKIFLEKYIQFSSKYSKLANESEALKFEMEILERMCSLEGSHSSSGHHGRKLSEILP
jgi:predicted transcriptional regulator